MPRYTVVEVGRMLDIPAATVSSWFVGMGTTFRPVLERSSPHTKLLSFENLVEVHVLRALRQRRVRMLKVREAIAILRQDFGAHPLASAQFKTDGRHIFVQILGNLISLNEGQ